MPFLELTEEVEKNFFKTLASLKTKDPRIYDEKVVFFNENTGRKGDKEKKEKKLTLADLERKVMLEKGWNETPFLWLMTNLLIFFRKAYFE
jgi:protein KRI1